MSKHDAGHDPFFPVIGAGIVETEPVADDLGDTAVILATICHAGLVKGKTGRKLNLTRIGAGGRQHFKLAHVAFWSYFRLSAA